MSWSAISMNARAWKRMCRGASRWRCGAGGAALLLLVLGVGLPLPPPVLTTARFPHVAPTMLAHKLADFSTHLLLYPHLGEWSVEEESGNYTAWRYVVSYACGSRCSGRAHVTALDRHAHAHAAHAPPIEHRVIVAHRSCTRPPLIHWPETCDEWETETVIVPAGDGAGSKLVERARASCGVLRRLLPAAVPASCTAQLRHQRDQHLLRLQALLAGLRA